MSRHPMTMPGAKRLMPGAYSVGDALHIVASELLAAGGFADTAENQAMVDEVMQRLGREIGAPVVYADEDEEGEP
ncbi:MAG TPA: hypothetical protein VES39_01120 [Rhodospirillales bacterium]|nr:hypothetical protein [Rhodospirillales bacterium]